MLESKIEKTVCKYAESKNWLTFKFVSPGNRSVPDRIFMRSSEMFMIEFKAPGKKSTKLQCKTHREIDAEGFTVWEVDSIEYGKYVIDFYGDK